MNTATAQTQYEPPRRDEDRTGLTAIVCLILIVIFLSKAARGDSPSLTSPPPATAVRAWADIAMIEQRTYVLFSNGQIGLFGRSVQDVSELFGCPAIGAGAPTVVGWYHPEDVNRDSVVDFEDMNAVLANWGAESPPMTSDHNPGVK